MQTLPIVENNPRQSDYMEAYMDSTGKYNIRLATVEDAPKLLDVYSYYVKNTAITFEYDVPDEEEFRGRIETVLRDFPYLVVEEVISDSQKSHENSEKCKPDKSDDLTKSKPSRILGYAYASKFHPRAAYKWCVEMSIYLDKDCKRAGLGRALYEELEKRLKDMGILNLYACIGYPEKEDEYLTFDSVRFHEKMGYKLNGEFHKCGYKFGRWYNMVWMEKMIGEHGDNPCIKSYQHT